MIADWYVKLSITIAYMSRCWKECCGRSSHSTALVCNRQVCIVCLAIRLLVRAKISESKQSAQAAEQVHSHLNLHVYCMQITWPRIDVLQLSVDIWCHDIAAAAPCSTCEVGIWVNIDLRVIASLHGNLQTVYLVSTEQRHTWHGQLILQLCLKNQDAPPTEPNRAIYICFWSPVRVLKASIFNITNQKAVPQFSLWSMCSPYQMYREYKNCDCQRVPRDGPKKAMHINEYAINSSDILDVECTGVWRITMAILPSLGPWKQRPLQPLCAQLRRQMFCSINCWRKAPWISSSPP